MSMRTHRADCAGVCVSVCSRRNPAVTWENRPGANVAVDDAHGLIRQPVLNSPVSSTSHGSLQWQQKRLDVPQQRRAVEDLLLPHLVIAPVISLLDIVARKRGGICLVLRAPADAPSAQRGPGNAAGVVDATCGAAGLRNAGRMGRLLGADAGERVLGYLDGGRRGRRGLGSHSDSTRSR